MKLFSSFNPSTRKRFEPEREEMNSGLNFVQDTSPTPPCLRPILQKFKKVRDYGKRYNDDSATFRSNPKFQGSFGVFRKALARENETLFDLFNKKTEDSVMGSPVPDSDCMKSKIQDC
ncbi:hypothetical protein ACFX1Z_043013 [Malus domestica]